MAELSKSYDPTEVEPKWRDAWIERGYFRADEHSEKPPFTIVIPPPNVTGSLHMGHALFATLQDVFTRYKRMAGFEALWLPGTDHAGIATQVLVERHLRAEGIDPQGLGREGFLERVWQWKDRYHARITAQLKTMGVSVDWDRERFTMDEGLSHAVRKVFVDLYEQGLIYQAERLVNWDPVGQTVLSDLEVEQEEEDGFLWHIAYPAVDDPARRLVVATTRPETMLGDTAVAVHPDDERHRDLIGKHVVLPLTGRTIPVIGDPQAADMTFGSGAVKITPGHDFNDFETGLRNDLPRLTVLDRQGRVVNAPERFVGLDRFEARKVIVAELEAQGFLVKTEPYRFMPGRSQRTGAIVEPMSIGKQWFVDAAKLAGPAIDAVKDGRTRFIPEMWEKTYFNWMENLREWCISRQLWWGHRIPAWYRGDELVVAMEPPAGDGWVQDDDVLDTWFSSGLWPFSTLGWPEKTASLEKFYPTTVLETGYDIIFFWVARMMMLGLHFMGEPPFEIIYLHGMLRDLSGKKMSKTNGNVIDPLHIIGGVKPGDLDEKEREHYAGLFREYPDGVAPQGADALRFALSVFSAQGRDVKLDVRRIEGYRAFLNKIWNASKFALMVLDEGASEVAPFDYDALAGQLSPADRWILGRLHATSAAVTAALDEYRVSDAADAVYHFAWHELCDWYLELSKAALYDKSEAGAGARAAAQATLLHALHATLAMLHPFAPFISEEIYQALPKPVGSAESLCIAAWPTPARLRPVADEANLALGLEVITGIRAVRGNNDIKPGLELPRVLLFHDDPAARAQLGALGSYIAKQAKVAAIDVCEGGAERPSPAATSVAGGVEIVIPLAGLIDVAAERARLSKELEKVLADIAFVEKKLGNAGFVAKAPEAVVAKEREKLDGFVAARKALEDGLRALEA
jgi:valyl-tRNA synthetase